MNYKELTTEKLFEIYKEIECELDNRRQSVKLQEAKIVNANWYFLIEDMESNSDYENAMFYVVKKDFWNKYGHIDDNPEYYENEDCIILPPKCTEAMESCFEFYDTDNSNEIRKRLIEYGFEEAFWDENE